MKILALVGSFRKRGNTARAIELILEEMNLSAGEAGIPLETETIFLSEMDLRMCRGCRACFDRGESRCPLKDDSAAVFEKMRAADGLIVASPIYVDDVSGLTKTWIDRLAFLCHRPALARQSALLVTTTAGSPSGHAMRTLSVALLTWGAHIAGQAGFKMGALLPADELPRLRPRARKAARQLLNAVRRRAHETPSFISLMTFRIQQATWSQEPAGTLDHTYWRENGWLTEAREFYIPNRSGRLKTLLARWVGGLIARLAG